MMKNGLLKSVVFLALMMIFSSCGGGGGGGGHGGGGVDATPPTVSSTSPFNGAKDISVNSAVKATFSEAMDVATINAETFTVSGATGDVTYDGASRTATFKPSSPLAFNTNYTATITTGVKDTAGNALSAGHVWTFKTGTFLAFANVTSASVVIGQANFTTGVLNQGLPSADANTINTPYGNAAVYNGVLYLADSDNNRILGFNSLPAANNAGADFVLGQPDFTTTTAGTAGNKFDGPQTVVIDGGKMFAVDYWNSRVLIWNGIPTSTGVLADVVVGQPNFTSSDFDCANNKLNSPESIHVVNGMLIVSDSFNNRVLIWKSIPTSNGQPADIVLGQAGFTSCSANRGGAVAAANTLDYPSGVWSEGDRLIVADANNYRVLIWNTFPTSNGQPADVVLGQTNMTTNVLSAASNNDFGYPYFLHSNGNQLFVADSDYNRVLIWDSIPVTDQAPAAHVLGQADFTGSGFGTSSTQFYFPAGVFAFDNKLIVTDTGNNRYLIFEAP